MTQTAMANIIEHDVSGIHAGAIHVIGVVAEDRQGPDGRYTSVSVELTPPNGETWDADDFYEVRRQARQRVIHVLGDDADFHITFTSGGDLESSDSVADPLEDGAALEKRSRR